MLKDYTPEGVASGAINERTLENYLHSVFADESQLR